MEFFPLRWELGEKNLFYQGTINLNFTAVLTVPSKIFQPCCGELLKKV